MSLEARFKTAWMEGERSYTGMELKPHFLLRTMGLKGSAVAAFLGPCAVAQEALVDWEDRLHDQRIEAKAMLHFLGEFFHLSLKEGVLFQRRILSQMALSLSLRLPNRKVYCEGDDLFIDEGKLSVAVTTASPVSVLFHIGINVNPQGAPIQKVVGLGGLGIEPKGWATDQLSMIEREYAGMEWACSKARPVM